MSENSGNRNIIGYKSLRKHYRGTLGTQSRKATSPSNSQDLATQALILRSVPPKHMLTLAGVAKGWAWRLTQLQPTAGLGLSRLILQPLFRIGLCSPWLQLNSLLCRPDPRPRPETGFPKHRAKRCGQTWPCRFQVQILTQTAAKPEFVHAEHVQLLTKFKNCSWGLVRPTANLRLDKQIPKSTGVENFSAFLEVLSRQIRPLENILFPQVTHFYKTDISFLNIDVISYHP